MLALICALTACTYGPEPNLLVRDDRPARSQAALDEVVGTVTSTPGCSAAVANDGKVVWQGVRGAAVLEPLTEITVDTTFDIGSVSKQFTALAIGLLAEQGALSLADHLSDHLDSYPGWADEVTLEQLVHHTSGIREIDLLATDAGVSGEMELSFAEVLAVIAKYGTELDFEPGTEWAYSSSNYLLLAAVLEQVTGQSLPEHLQRTFFDPLELTMTVGPPLNDPGRTRSYRAGANGQFEIIDLNADARGATGIRSTPAELARWADVYRTGQVAGTLVTDPATDAAPGAPENGRYGHGIIISPESFLWHSGDTGGFHTAFGVSPDRHWSGAVSCNAVGLDAWKIFDTLAEIWAPS